MESQFGRVHNAGWDFVLSRLYEGTDDGSNTHPTIFDTLGGIVSDFMKTTSQHLSDSVAIDAGLDLAMASRVALVQGDTATLRRIMDSLSLSTHDIGWIISFYDLCYHDYQDVDGAISAVDSLVAEYEFVYGENSYHSDVAGLYKASLLYWQCMSEDWAAMPYNSVAARKRWYETMHDMAVSDMWAFAVGTLMTGPAGGMAAGCYGSAAKGIADLVTGQCCD